MKTVVEGDSFAQASYPTGMLSLEDLGTRRWQEIVEDLVSDADPWEISVVEMARHYRRMVEGVDPDNLELTGRMVIVCAWFLRLKAEQLGGQKLVGSEEEELIGWDEGLYSYEDFGESSFVPLLNVPVKPVNKRLVSKGELREARDDALRVYSRRKERYSYEMENEDSNWWGVEFQDTDGIRKKLDQLFEKVKTMFTRGKRVLFSHLLDQNSEDEKLSKFIQLLHLEGEGKVECKQDEPFGEIEIVEVSPESE